MRRSVLAVICSCALTLPLALAQTPASMSYKSAATTQYVNHPALPPCAKMAVQDGNPDSGSAIIAVKAAANCNIPWHWHTANERLLIVSGTAKAEMKDMPATMLSKGDFLLLPGKGIHQFTSQSEVQFFIVTDGAFDIHYVDNGGKEIPPEQALKKTAGL